MLGMKYLSETHLKGFDRYKYNSIDTSFLSVYIMHPFWNECVKIVPRWVAPNLLTFSGFLLTILNFLIIGYFDWGFDAANGDKNTVPRYIWLIAAINIFVAYTLDGIDGKQARRTGTSGPLGELFDHGVDSYSSVLVPIYMFSLFGTLDLPPIRMFFVIWNVFLNFYLSHFEKYNTGVMFLPWGYDFTMWGVTLTLFASWCFGPEIWRHRLPYGIVPARVFEFILISSGLVTSHPIIIKNIYNSYRKRTGKMRPILEALRPLYPFGLLFVITTLWVWYSRNQILDLEPRIMFVLFGTIFSNISCRLIVAQMSDTRTDAWNALMWPLCFVAFMSCVPVDELLGFAPITVHTERWMVYMLTTFATFAHIHYGHGIVREMCDHFNIKCFRITKPIAGMDGV
ncbi:unnamed protein product [Hermetia illucens]|uniref:Ethanolaminephosphotransferase n=1 Tax=Hermetia illucens TaxID=343691 RepID=A0A7R8YP04_HERIL|nr:ethanolaminephosphotransferase 1 isoform X2 [Hermetia illucens]CAD7079801.1 unnamed protein product [Hermetia illucens]